MISLATGHSHSFALLEDGKVYGWGWNRYFQLGDGTTQNRWHPQIIKGLPGKVVKVATGYYHSLAPLLEDGRLFGWGENAAGGIGDGTTEDISKPKLISSIPGQVVDLAAGEYHSLALLENGDIYGWGHNTEGQLGGSLKGDVISPLLISKVDKGIIISPFGKGGRAVGFAKLEKNFRKLIGSDIHL